MIANSQPSISTPDGGRKRAGKHRRRLTVWGWVAEIALILVLALGISAILRHFVMQVYSIPTPSMTSTLRVGDRILVNRIPGVGKQVDRGDVVVFEDQQSWMSESENFKPSALRSVGEFLGLVPADGKQVMVKRVIGVGGDAVSCCTPEGLLQVNGQAIDEPYLDEGITHARRDFEVKVPEGKLWVMGDNRLNSADSLYHLAEGTEFIDMDAIIGKAQWVIWPFNHWSTIPDRQAFADVSDPS